MSKTPQYHPAVLDKWIVFCDQCGNKFYNTEVKKRWDGVMVCEKDWDPVPPIFAIRTLTETRTVPDSRPSKDKIEEYTPTAPNPLADGYYNPTAPVPESK